MGLRSATVEFEADLGPRGTEQTPPTEVGGIQASGRRAALAYAPDGR